MRLLDVVKTQFAIKEFWVTLVVTLLCVCAGWVAVQLVAEAV